MPIVHLSQVVSRIISNTRPSLPEQAFPYEIIADEQRALATQLEMLDPLELGKDGIPLAARAVFVVGPDHSLRAQILYPATTGRNFE